MGASKDFLASILGGALLSGCVPGAELVSPAVRGTVVDARTRQPIVGASVTVAQSGETGQPVPLAQGTSDERGRISVSSHRKFGWVAIYGDYYTKDVLTVQITKQGYRPFAQPKNLGVALMNSPLYVNAKLEPQGAPVPSNKL